jgi:hypothetical protein
VVDHSNPSCRIAALFLLLVTAVCAATPGASTGVEVLRSVGGLPAHLVGDYDAPAGFQQAETGDYFVFDRGGHAVHRVDSSRVASRKLTDVGQAPGDIIQPTGFDVFRDGRFVVADVPRAQQRIQTFDADGRWLSGFFLPGQPAAHVFIGNAMLNGASSVQHTGRSLLISYPESGALFTEYSVRGYAQRSIGRLRRTGFEGDRDLHIAMNAGLPLVDPTGGFYYVFITGTPVFRKYDEQGALQFERHIEGRELDGLRASQPNQWPRRAVLDRVVPFVTPVVRAAAVNSSGELWISLSVPYTYVYSADGDRIRTVQFHAAGLLSPTSLSFAPNGRLLVTPGCYEFEPR